jgi:hypothetical protein
MPSFDRTLLDNIRSTATMISRSVAGYRDAPWKLATKQNAVTFLAACAYDALRRAANSCVASEGTSCLAAELL